MADLGSPASGLSSSASVPIEIARSEASDLLSFISASPSPFHAVAEASRRLEHAGFSRVREADSWGVAPGRHYLVRGGSLIAWSGDPSAAAAGSGFRILGAHTDSPNLRIKPQPVAGDKTWRQLAVEVYGGALLNSWLDRDLGISGRIAVAIDDSIHSHLFRDDRPLLRIPQLAIHLDRDINTQGLKLNPQLHMIPTWGVGHSNTTSFHNYLANAISVEPGDIVSWDLGLHDVNPGTISGLENEFVSSARLDNQLSCWAAVEAITANSAPMVSGGPLAVIALFDHEEVGSVSHSGAGSDLLGSTLERIVLAGGGDRGAFLQTLRRSWCVSADGAHATHPNYGERHEPNHHIALNAGPVIKHNSNERYATNAMTSGLFELVCGSIDVPVQHFVSRSDMACGSTIGPVTASALGIATVDVGVAQLAMHSIREMCGALDPALFKRALTACLVTSLPTDNL